MSAPATDDGPVLDTERLRLRRWVASDREPFAALNADPEVMRHFPGLLTRADSDALADRFDAEFTERGFGLWAVEVPGVTTFAGFVGLSVPTFDAHFTPCVELGWRLARQYWERGYATEGARAALAFAFDELNLAEVVAITIPSNTRSRRVMEKLGMTQDERDNFDHPRLATDHPLRRHVLYRAARPARR